MILVLVLVLVLNQDQDQDQDHWNQELDFSGFVNVIQVKIMRVGIGKQIMLNMRDIQTVYHLIQNICNFQSTLWFKKKRANFGGL